MRRVHFAAQFVLGASIGALLLATSCSEAEKAPQPSGRPMAAETLPEQGGGNNAPVVERVRLDPSEPLPGVDLAAVVDAQDPDGDAIKLSYTWRVNGRPVPTDGRSTVSLPGLEKGDRVEVAVVASDGRAESRARTARGRVRNRPPFVDGVTFTPQGTVRAGETILASPSAQDPDGDKVDFRYTWLVNGAERSESRELSTAGMKRGDRIQVRVTAHDGEAASRPVESSEVVLGNTPPVITALPDLETDSGEFRYTFEAIDGDGDRNLRFWLEQSPPGMHIDPILGVLTWRPDADQAGVHEVEVGVKDKSGDGTTFLFEVTVTASQPSPPAALAR